MSTAHTIARRARIVAGIVPAAILCATAAAGAWHIDPALVAHFSVIRTELHIKPASRPRAPASVGQMVQVFTSVGRGYGASPIYAAKTTVGPAADPVWIVPGSYGACLAETSSPGEVAGSCVSTSAAIDGRFWLLGTIPYGPHGARRQVLLGVAPNNDATVTINWVGGTSTTTPVHNNVYSVPIAPHRGWTSVKLNTPTGAPEQVPGMGVLPPQTPRNK